MFSRELGCIFFHIPKTAGTSVERWLGLGDADPAVANHEKLFGWERDGKFYLQHALPETVRQLLGAEVFERCYRFSIVRNPFARSVSVYHYLFNRHQQRYGSFTEYVRALPSLLNKNTRITRSLGHHLPQIRYTQLDGVDCCHDIVRFEQLPDSLKPVAQRLGLQHPLPFHNTYRHPVRGNRPVASFYTQETARLLVDIYAEDFAAYGYSTDPEAADAMADPGLGNPLGAMAVASQGVAEYSSGLKLGSNLLSFPSKSSKNDPLRASPDNPAPMNARTAILFLAHFWNPTLAFRFNRLRREAAGIADCYLLLQNLENDQLPADIDIASGVVKRFDPQQLQRELGYSFFGLQGIEPGSCHFPLIEFARDAPYDYYWLVEYDVEYTGHWGELITACEQDKADLIASHLYSQQERPLWMWWSSLRPPSQSVTLLADLHPIKVFLPIYRISRNALAFIDSQHQAGWSGQYEVLIPALLREQGFEVADLLKVGRFYRGTEQDPTAESGKQSTLRHRPEITLAEFMVDLTPDTIYHPVKEPWTYDGKNVVVAVSPAADEPAHPSPDKRYPVRTAGYIAEWEQGLLRVRVKSAGSGSRLNQTAALIWSLCDGQGTEEELINQLQARYPDQSGSVAADVRNALTGLESLGLIAHADTPAPEPRPLVSVAFAGFGPDFQADDNFLSWMLTHRFDVVLANAIEDTPDFLFYRHPVREPFDMATMDRDRTFSIQVRADGEAPDFTDCDYALSTQAVYARHAHRHCQLPVWVYHLDWWTNDRGTTAFNDKGLPSVFHPESVCEHLYQAWLAEPEPEPIAAPQRTLPAAAPLAPPRKLTIGMATYDDFDGVYFTLQSLRLNHPDIADETEYLIVDNHPEGPAAQTLRQLADAIPACRYVAHHEARGTASRDVVFRLARTDYVLCLDSHILLAPGSLRKFIDYLEARPDCGDLLQGPLVRDDLSSTSTHFEPVWSAGMFGRWGTDERGLQPDGEPFDIPMQGLGVFGCRRKAWLGFNPRFSGFGGEEGYLHEKFRQAGHRALCLPFLRWVHRFQRPLGVPYRNTWEDRIRNYYIGFQELGWDTAPIDEHFQSLLGEGTYGRIRTGIIAELANPFFYFDEIYCINLDRATDRWEAMQRRFTQLGIAHRVRRFSAIETPESHHIGCTLSHRAIIERARLRGLRHVLVFEDDALFLEDTLIQLSRSIEELRTQPWRILHLGGHKWGQNYPKADGCQYLEAPCLSLTCAHAVAYHESVYEEILAEIPGDLSGVRGWLKIHHGIDQYLCRLAGRYVTWPVVASQPPLLAQEAEADRHRFTL